MKLDIGVALRYGLFDKDFGCKVAAFKLMNGFAGPGDGRLSTLCLYSEK